MRLAILHYTTNNNHLFWLSLAMQCETRELDTARVQIVGVSNCNILWLVRFWNITYHDCENNHDYIILTIFDEKSMQ